MNRFLIPALGLGLALSACSSSGGRDCSAMMKDIDDIAVMRSRTRDLNTAGLGMRAKSKKEQLWKTILVGNEYTLEVPQKC